MNRKGFTISETLMAVLIMSLAGIIIAAGVTVASNTYREVTQKANAQVLLSTSITACTDDLRYATNIETDSSDTVTSFNASNRGTTISYSSNTEDGILITAGSEEVPLVTDKTMSDNLYTVLDSFTYKDSVFKFTISIYSRDDSANAIETQSISVRPINEG